MISRKTQLHNNAQNRFVQLSVIKKYHICFAQFLQLKNTAQKLLPLLHVELKTKRQSILCFFQCDGNPTEEVLSRNSSLQNLPCRDHYYYYKGSKNNLRRTDFHHGIASFHTSRQTIDYLKKKNFELLFDCAYSPSLNKKCVDCYYHNLKKQLKQYKSMFRVQRLFLELV